MMDLPDMIPHIMMKYGWTRGWSIASPATAFPSATGLW